MRPSIAEGSRASAPGPLRRPLFATLSLVVGGLAVCEAPRPPASCGPIPQLRVHARETATVQACFNDPDGDVLWFAAASSDTAVAAASVSGTAIAVVAVAPGAAVITVTASDPGGLEGLSKFQVLVPNRGPRAAGSIESRVLVTGDTVTVDAAAHFTEPDGEALAYSAVSSAPDAVPVWASGSDITLAALSRGAANIEITATDPGGLSASQAFRVRVRNRPPAVLDTIPSLTLHAGDRDTLDVSAFFADPDGDVLTFEAVATVPGVVEAVAEGSLVVVGGVARGTAAVIVTATDPDSLSASQTFDVTVPNSAPTAVGSLPVQELKEGETSVLDVLPYFADADGDPLVYTASVTDPGVAAVSVEDNAVLIAGVAAGTTALTVTARDPEGAEVVQGTVVTVLPGGSPDLVVASVWPQSVEVPSGGAGPVVVFTVENVGTAAARTGRTLFLGSHDALVSPSDSVLGVGVLPGPVAPGGTVTVSYAVQSAEPPGTRFHAGICLDSVPRETGVGNNCSPAVQVSVVAGPVTGDGYVVPAYLTQAVQTSDFAVPLVAGEQALLRVFVAADGDESLAGQPRPPVQVSFYEGEDELHVANIPAGAGLIPVHADEGDLRSSANALIPGDVIRPHLEMVVHIDPDGMMDGTLGPARRIPALGRLQVDVWSAPELSLTLVPLLWSSDPHRSVVDAVRHAVMDPQGDELLWGVRELLPVGSLSVSGHAPVTTSSNRTDELLRDIEALRVVEGGRGHYMGLMERFDTYAGRAFTPGRTSVAVPRWGTVAHELGHNFSLAHAPCGDPPRPDPAFPNADGTIGVWGYDFRANGQLVPPTWIDIMSYCFSQRWISDYHFSRALEFRLFDEGAGSATSMSAKSLLLWGGVDAQSVPFLEPVLVIDAPAELPTSDGDYRLIGSTADGAELFTLNFDMPETGDGDGGSGFVFALPVRPGWDVGLASVTLLGPEGSAKLDRSTDRPMAILRDPRTGEVRGFLRNLSAEALVGPAEAAAAMALELGLEVLISRGLPDAQAWRGLARGGRQAVQGQHPPDQVRLP